MKWDIDKALRSLEDPHSAGTSVDRTLIDVSHTQLLADLRLKAPKGAEGSMLVWTLGIGKLAQRKLFIHGWSIREAYLKARRIVNKMTVSDRTWYGIPTPKKRNSYASARRKAKPRKKT